MPYITKPRRELLDPTVADLAKRLEGLASQKGDLNYVVTRLIAYRLKVLGKSYDTLSDVTGILNDIKTEFERRVVAPYEDEAIERNGDVY